MSLTGKKKKETEIATPSQEECCLPLAPALEWEAKRSRRGASEEEEGGGEKRAGWVDGSGNIVSRGRGES